VTNCSAAAAQALELAEGGFRAIKVRLGYPTIAADIAVVRAVRRAVGDAMTLMSDYNQALSPAEAEQRARALDAEGLAWIEEPVRFDDYAGCARVAAAVTSCPPASNSIDTSCPAFSFFWVSWRHDLK